VIKQRTIELINSNLPDLRKCPICSAIIGNYKSRWEYINQDDQRFEQFRGHHGVSVTDKYNLRGGTTYE
jgi:hypothetical protein